MAELRLLFRYPKGRIFNDNDFELVPAPVPIAVDEYPAFLGLRQQVWLPPKQAFVDDKILPTWSGGLDEYNAFIPQLQSLWFAKQPQVDEDAGITLATFALEDGEPWVARFQQQYTPQQPIQDEDKLPFWIAGVDIEIDWPRRYQAWWQQPPTVFVDDECYPTGQAQLADEADPPA